MGQVVGGSLPWLQKQLPVLPESDVRTVSVNQLPKWWLTAGTNCEVDGREHWREVADAQAMVMGL